MARVNVEASLVAYLRSCGFAAYGDAPDGGVDAQPASFVTVERTGGGSSDWYSDEAAVAVQAWAPTRSQALTLAIAVDTAMAGFTEKRGICRVDPRELTNFPPLDGTGRGRYQAVYSVITQHTPS